METNRSTLSKMSTARLEKLQDLQRREQLHDLLRKKLIDQYRRKFDATPRATRVIDSELDKTMSATSITRFEIDDLQRRITMRALLPDTARPRTGLGTSRGSSGSIGTAKFMNKFTPRGTMQGSASLGSLRPKTGAPGARLPAVPEVMPFGEMDDLDKELTGLQDPSPSPEQRALIRRYLDPPTVTSAEVGSFADEADLSILPHDHSKFPEVSEWVDIRHYQQAEYDADLRRHKEEVKQHHAATFKMLSDQVAIVEEERKRRAEQKMQDELDLLRRAEEEEAAYRRRVAQKKAHDEAEHAIYLKQLADTATQRALVSGIEKEEDSALIKRMMAEEAAAQKAEEEKAARMKRELISFMAENDAILEERRLAAIKEREEDIERMRLFNEMEEAEARKRQEAAERRKARLNARVAATKTVLDKVAEVEAEEERKRAEIVAARERAQDEAAAADAARRKAANEQTAKILNEQLAAKRLERQIAAERDRQEQQHIVSKVQREIQAEKQEKARRKIKAMQVRDEVLQQAAQKLSAPAFNKTMDYRERMINLPILTKVRSTRLLS